MGEVYQQKFKSGEFRIYLATIVMRKAFRSVWNDVEKKRGRNINGSFQKDACCIEGKEMKDIDAKHTLHQKFIPILRKNLKKPGDYRLSSKCFPIYQRAFAR